METPGTYGPEEAGQTVVWDIETVPLGYDPDGYAALHPLTGRVAMIGVRRPNGTWFSFEHEDERQLLCSFLKWCEPVMTFIGFNSVAFDLAFVVRRAWMLGIGNDLVANLDDSEHIDLMRLWMRGDVNRVSLRTLSKALGVGEKNGSGADFAKMDANSREKYLERDLYLTARCAQRMVVEAAWFEFPEDG